MGVLPAGVLGVDYALADQRERDANRAEEEWLAASNAVENEADENQVLKSVGKILRWGDWCMGEEKRSYCEIRTGNRADTVVDS